jgi:hypothetical protein
MSNHEPAVDVLIKYYESLSNDVVVGLGKYFDETVTLISLTGSNVVRGTEELEAVFQNLVDTWKKLGVSRKIQYDRAKFRIEDIQDNVKTIRTRLTNFKETGEVFESWNCMYVMCDSADGWKITLVTFDDKGTENFAAES